MKTIEAVIDANGHARPIGDAKLPPGRRALVTLLEGEEPSETMLLSEAALAQDWSRPEEDAAWAHLQPAK